MTTAVEQDVRVRWDYFLRKDGEPNAVQVRMIDTFRENEWPRIQRDLLHRFHWDIPAGLEPHWIAPGRIVYWAEEITLGKRFVDDGKGGHFERTETSQGWKPTSGLSATSASPIAHFLDKGFRFRPPLEGVASEVFNESAIPPEAPPEPEDTRPVFTCLRHGDLRQFRTWDAYLQHCVHYKEAPTEPPPDSVLALARYALQLSLWEQVRFEATQIVLWIGTAIATLVVLPLAILYLLAVVFSFS